MEKAGPKGAKRSIGMGHETVGSSSSAVAVVCVVRMDIITT